MYHAIIVAGGSGQRFGSPMPKQFLDLNGLPIIIHSINAFAKFNNQIRVIVVLPEYHIETWKNICKKYNYKKQHDIITGGNTRYQSVKNGLKVIQNSGLVAIHDAVRPLINDETIERCFHVAKEKGNAIPVIKLTDSIRKIDGSMSYPENRDAFVLVQTPQVFDIESIKKAYELPYSVDFTDDASVFEKSGYQIYLTEGNLENIKITTQEDLILAKAILNKKSF